MRNHTSSRGHSITRIMLAAATAVGASLSGCSLQSPYIRSSDIRAVNASSPACPRNGNSGHLAAQATEQQFEKAVNEHALFSNIVGEVLIPLTGIVAYRGTYKHGRNVLALATGGAAVYGVSSYLYKKPQEEIYLTGVSALECAVRIADSQTLGDEDRAMLQALVYPQAVTTTDSQAANTVRLQAAAELGRKLYEDANNRLRSAKTELDFVADGRTKLLDLLTDKTCKQSKSAVATIQKYLTKTQTRGEALQGRFNELDARLDRAESSARGLLAKDAQIDQQLCHAADQIRTDVNHMLVTQSADLAKLASTISVLKFPDTAPKGGTPAVAAAETVSSTDLLSRLDKFIPALAELAKKEDKRMPECSVEEANDNILSHEKSLSSALDDGESAVEQVEQGVAAATPNGARNDELFAQCGVDIVTKPKPLTVATGGDLSIEQGKSRQVLVSGGHPDYNAVLGNSPQSGAIAVKSGGDKASGYIVDVAPDSKAATGSYNVIVVDSAGATTSFTFKVIAKPNA